jgi:hypothetical protein
LSRLVVDEGLGLEDDKIQFDRLLAGVGQIVAV